MSAVVTLGRMTYAEYVAFERAEESRHEWVAGAVHAMAGGSPEHARLAGRMIHLLSAALAGRPCEVFTSDLRVRIVATGRATYPDVTVVCGKLEPDVEDPDAATNPSVLVEILSPTTEADDRGDKWAHYRRIPSLRAYLLVSQHEPRVEAFRRDGDRWLFEDAGPGQTLIVGGLDVALAVDELFARALG